MSQGFIKLYREKAVELLEDDPKAYLLLSQIALRARRTDKEYSRVLLKANQAFIGDPEKAGLTAQEYKNAKKRLTQYGLVIFQSCNKGTIATLINKDIFDINAEENITVNKPAISPAKNQSYQPTKNQQTTTKEPMEIHQETKKEPLTRKEEAKKATTIVADAFLYNCLQKHQQLSDIEKQDLMKYSEDRVIKALEWAAQNDLFLPGYREWLFQYCENYFKLNRCGYYSYDDYSWVGFNPENLDSFLLTEKGLLLIFQNYIIGGFDDYPVTLLIPYAELTFIANSDMLSLQ